MSQEHRDDLVETAQRYLPGGSSWMWTLPRDLSFVVDRAEGSHLIDTNGRRYIDYALGSGPLLLGHAHPALTAAVKAQIDRGSTYQWLSEPTIRLAEMICQAVPCGDQVRFVSTGTEATMYAIRIARVATRREKVLKFEGGWHGLHDYALVGNGWRPSTEPYPTPTPDTGGIPKGALDSMLVVPFNDLTATADAIDRHGDDIAAVIVEPLQRALPPQPGFLGQLREITRRKKIVLIFDEVVTGFRIGWSGAQGALGITPDLTTLGKVVGGGLPIGAYGGRRDLMEMVAPSGPVYQAGTLAGNPISVAAGLATLRELSKPGTYERLESLASELEAGIGGAIDRAGVPAGVQRVGSMMTLFFVDGLVTNFDEAKLCDTGWFRHFFHEMLAWGVYLPPSQLEASFVSLAHTREDIAEVVAAVEESLERSRP